MKSCLSQAGDRVGIVNSVEADHSLWIKKRYRTVIVGHCKDVAKFEVVNGDYISIRIDIFQPSKFNFRLILLCQNNLDCGKPRWFQGYGELNIYLCLNVVFL